MDRRTSWTKRLCVLAVLAAGWGVAPGPARAGGRLLACREPGWPQWRGPRRDSVSDETGLLGRWPAGGPRRLWTAEGLGKGWSSPVFGAGAIYITGDVGRQLRVFALSPEGRLKWQAANGANWAKPFGGSRAACCYDDGRVYNMNAHGRVVCLDARTGREIWAVEVFKRFDAKVPYFGAAECLLVDGPRLIVSPGGKKGLLAALDKKTGRTVWASDLGAAADETAGYSSPVLVELNGRRQVIATSSARTFAADAGTGKVLWTYKLNWNKQSSSTIPVFRGDSVFITNSTRTDCAFYRLRIAPDNSGAEKVWNTNLSTSHGSVVCVDGMLFGASSKKMLGWACIEAETGKVRYLKKNLAVGSMAWADGRLYCLSQEGEMALLKPGAEGFEQMGRFRLVSGGKDAWAHPVILDGRLYLRYHDRLYCYDIRKG